MRKRISFIVAVLSVLVLTTITSAQASSAMAVDQSKATWLWHTEQIKQDSDKVLAFLASKETNVLYLQVNRDISKSIYASFIQKATAQSISVHALDGSSSWLSDKRGQDKRNASFNWIEAYNQSASPDAQFSGIRLDIEPYVRASWKTDYVGTVQAYQTILSEGKQVADRLGVEYGLDIPFWFDNRFYDNAFGEGTLSEWLIDTADQVTIMAYRDKADGRNGIISLSSDEIAYANQVNKQVFIGVDTKKSSEGDNLSFYKKSDAFMNEVLAIVEDAFTTSESFSGFAIHSIDGWMDMK